ncbi:MAG TPA: DNA polymerase III subunit delta' [Hyphomicrobiaceae bacterium]|jgi:DNA polymerase-3 subunit delta'|nr:DNA polymerase III subunit delta' [Hyphomicrobiaceae bacterium]
MARTATPPELEATPEADRLEGFPHPRETTTLFGHAAAERTLAEAFAGGQMHHAWLLSGRGGIGKATLAYRLARHALAEPRERDAEAASLDVAPDTRAARQVKALSHPGLLLLRRPYDARAKRFAQSIPVDEVRRLKSFLGLTSAGGSWRVVLIDSADELNLNAANAVLKSLEEPPARTLFLLLSAAPSQLLPTIRSRCRRLDLDELAAEPLRAAVTAALAARDMDPPDAAAWGELERIAHGSVRRALQLVAAGGLALNARIERLVGSLPRLDWQLAHALSDDMGYGAPEQSFATFFELFLDQLARLVRARATGQGSPAERDLAERLIAPERLPAWAEFWTTAVAEKADAGELNLDRKATLTSLFARLETLARA